MYTFTVVKGDLDRWWVVAVSWIRPKLILKDESLAHIIGMECGRMRTEIIRYYGAEAYDNGGTYWNSEYEAKKAVEVFFQPRLTANILAKGDNLEELELEGENYV